MDDYFKDNESIKGYIPEIDYEIKSISFLDLFLNNENILIKSNINEINEIINLFPFPYEQPNNSDIISSVQIIPDPKKELFKEISKNETQEKSNKEQPKKSLLVKKKKNPSLKDKIKKSMINLPLITFLEKYIFIL